jgi:flagellar biosynthesis GTPase FlhF
MKLLIYISISVILIIILTMLILKNKSKKNKKNKSKKNKKNKKSKKDKKNKKSKKNKKNKKSKKDKKNKKSKKDKKNKKSKKNKKNKKSKKDKKNKKNKKSKKDKKNKKNSKKNSKIKKKISEYKKIIDSKNKSYNVYSVSNEDSNKFKKGDYPSTYGYLTEKGLARIITEIKIFKNDKNYIKNKNFIDLGSGDGKLVIYSLAYPFKKSYGVELAEERHNFAESLKSKLSESDKKRINFYNGDLLKQDVSDIDIIYISSLCFNTEFLKKIALKLEKELKKGVMIFTSSELNSNKLKFIKNFNAEQSWDKNSNIYMYEKI